ncbi:hypothetical protein Tco_0996263, partial [Tanacetum coccineum]
VPQSSDPSENVVDEAVYKELGNNLVRAATTASILEAEQDSDEEITLVSVQNVDEEMFDVNILDGKSTTTTIISSQQSHDKGKGILIEPVEPMKKKDLIRLDEKVALKLQDEFDEEERLAREKANKRTEANTAFDET